MDFTIEHVLTFEDTLAKLVNNDYAIALGNAWWDRLMTERPIGGRQETWEFLLTNADIHLLPEGQMIYDELVKQFLVLKSQKRGTGLKIKRDDWLDDKLDPVADWAGQAGAAMALAPQYQAVDLLKAGETGKAYDGKAFFATDHPTNPGDAGAGTYSNLLSPFPLADPITGHANLASLNEAKAKMRSYSMPNGRNRNLVPSAIVCAPRNEMAALEAAQARYLTATENVFAEGFGGKINGKINNGLDVIVVNELENASDPDSWYLVASNNGSGLLPFVYGLREAYFMTSYTGATQVTLARADELEWIIRGRNVAIYGHPYSMIKVKSA
jgi:phage major head subunit gpT-like protein